LGKDDKGNFQNVLVQSEYGSGKTGAFTIGSVMRVDPTIKKPQVICIVDIRELAAQICEVYQKLTKFTDIKILDLVATGKWEGCHIVVSTLGTLRNFCYARIPIDFSELRVVVIDEANFLFRDDDNKKQLEGLNRSVFSKLKQKIQWILFSATYPEHVFEAVA
jgi:ATP-dependent RNA helicase DDX19/DBP5